MRRDPSQLHSEGPSSESRPYRNRKAGLTQATGRILVTVMKEMIRIPGRIEAAGANDRHGLTR